MDGLHSVADSSLELLQCQRLARQCVVRRPRPLAFACVGCIRNWYWRAAAVVDGSVPLSHRRSKRRPSIQDALIEAIASAEPSVVSIARVRPADAAEAARTEGDLIPSEFGTGVIVDAGGAILTCRHVISKDPESAYFVTTSDRKRCTEHGSRPPIRAATWRSSRSRPAICR